MPSTRTFSFLVLVLLLCCSESVLGYTLQVWEGPEYRIPDSTPSPLTLSFKYNASDPEDVSILAMMAEKNLHVVVYPYTEEPWHVLFENSTMVFSADDIKHSVNHTYTIISYYWGYFPVFFYGNLAAKSSEIVEGVNATVLGEKKLFRNDTMVICDRQQSSKTSDTIFMIGAVSFSLFNTVLMGTQLDLQIIISVIKKPIGPLCGVICQFICMPLFSFTVGWLLLDDPLQRLGLFTLGCSPGGQNSNFYTLLFNGDINLSITMTFCSTIIAMGMMPTWMFLLGSRLLGPESSIKVPYTKLITSLITFSIPLFIGLLIKYKKPRWAQFAGRIVKPMTFCMITYFITFGLYNQYKGMALITWNVAAAGLLVAGCGYSVGALLSALCCLKKKQIIAISIETAFQNAAIAYLLLKLSLGTPASDLAAVPVLAQLFQTGPPLLTVFLIWQAVQRCGYCVPEEDIRDKVDAEEAKLDATRALMAESPVDDMPRTPGLLFDPSMPESMRENTFDELSKKST